MKKWYKQTYFDRRSWILEYFDKLNITNDELVVLLLIDFAKDSKKTINYDYLKEKLNLDNKKIDSIISSLVSKKYLKITPTSKGVSFDIDSIFEFDPEQYELSENKDIYSIAEDLKGKPLSSTELQKLSDLSSDYPINKIIDAIRIAEAYRKPSIAYVESILKNEKK